MGRLLLLRHGQSVWNAAGRWQGRADPELSDQGEGEARRAATALKGVVEFVVSSPLRRAASSAAVIAEALDLDPPLTEADLVERDVGVWSGLTNDEVDSGWPGYRQERRPPPGWESDELLLERAIAAVRRILERSHGRVGVAVSHASLVRILEEHLGADRQALPNLAGRWIHVDGADLRLGDRLVLLDQPV